MGGAAIAALGLAGRAAAVLTTAARCALDALTPRGQAEARVGGAALAALGLAAPAAAVVGAAARPAWNAQIPHRQASARGGGARIAAQSPTACAAAVRAAAVQRAWDKADELRRRQAVVRGEGTSCTASELAAPTVHMTKCEGRWHVGGVAGDGRRGWEGGLGWETTRLIDMSI